MFTVLTLVKKRIRRAINSIRVKNKQKVFCIGRNKTGTTSVKAAFHELGYIIGEQDVAEHLFEQCFLESNYEPIIKYCQSAEVFQDVPFSFYQIIPHLDRAFPNSKFILTIRDTPEQWYQSFVKYYSKRSGVKDGVATYEDLKSSTYVSKTFRAKFITQAHGTPHEDPFNKEILIEQYNEHIEYVKNYFKNRPNDLLIINIAQENAFKQFLAFIGKESKATSFPWENKT